MTGMLVLTLYIMVVGFPSPSLSTSANFCPVDGADYLDRPDGNIIKVKSAVALPQYFHPKCFIVHILFSTIFIKFQKFLIIVNELKNQDMKKMINSKPIINGLESQVSNKVLGKGNIVWKYNSKLSSIETKKVNQFIHMIVHIHSRI